MHQGIGFRLHILSTRKNELRSNGDGGRQVVAGGRGQRGMDFLGESDKDLGPKLGNKVLHACKPKDGLTERFSSLSGGDLTPHTFMRNLNDIGQWVIRDNHSSPNHGLRTAGLSNSHLTIGRWLILNGRKGGGLLRSLSQGGLVRVQPGEKRRNGANGRFFRPFSCALEWSVHEARCYPSVGEVTITIATTTKRNY